ncbi:hypothetical protein U9M48_018119 [Paspalum notatum var. saurae]|uniref:Glycosyl transferase family 28 C-terminal domain-containing protein n=1 Tax=Paspalum notatum var. saurae TaxID=547442 RepID=A0AAQ3TA43_PASNO
MPRLLRPLDATRRVALGEGKVSLVLRRVVRPSPAVHRPPARTHPPSPTTTSRRPPATNESPSACGCESATRQAATRRSSTASRTSCGDSAATSSEMPFFISFLLLDFYLTGDLHELGKRYTGTGFYLTGDLHELGKRYTGTVDSPEVKNALLQKGYTDLLIQMGRGTYVPSKVPGDANLQVDHFTFSPSIADHMRTASLVISHAVPYSSDEGSGSIFETLRLGKPLIVVVNEDLMDNHQSELAEELAERKHLFCARPQTLGETIRAMDLDTLVPYVPGDAKPVATLINKFLGFPVD